MAVIRKKGPPDSIEELYEQWSGRVASTVRRFGFREDEVPDVMQELFTRFVEGKGGRTYLEIYDPSIAQFSTYMYSFVLPRLRGWYAASLHRSGKELPMFKDGDSMPIDFVDESAGRSFDEHGNVVSFDDVENSLALAQVIGNLRSSGDELSARVLEEMIQQAKIGKVNREMLREKLGISAKVLKNKIDHLKDHPSVKDWHDCRTS